MEKNEQANVSHVDDKGDIDQRLLCLMRGIQERDEDAFAQFYDLTVKKLFSIALHIIGNEQDAEEIICDVYTQIWQKADSYSAEKGAVMAWCYVIAKSRSLDMYRMNKTRSERLSENASEWQERQKSRLTKQDPLFSFNLNSLIWQCFNQLGFEQRNILSLAYVNGLSHREISDITGHPVGTIKSHVSRSLQKVNQYLLDLNENDEIF